MLQAEEGPVREAWLEKEVEAGKEWPVEGAWSEQIRPTEGAPLMKTLVEAGLAEGAWLAIEEQTEEAWPRERGELEQEAK